MARYSAEQIYAFARAAGFDPDGAATMTAIALAESSGNSNAHASTGEDSRGLWQINAAAHHDLAAKYDLWDPRDNAKAAFEVSHGGRDVSPWTTTHGGARASYLRYRDEAQEAAVAHGDPDGLGVWKGTRGYGHPLAASPHGSSGSSEHRGGSDSAGATHTTMAAETAPSGAEIVGDFVPLTPPATPSVTSTPAAADQHDTGQVDPGHVDPGQGDQDDAGQGGSDSGAELQGDFVPLQPAAPSHDGPGRAAPDPQNESTTVAWQRIWDAPGDVTPRSGVDLTSISRQSPAPAAAQSAPSAPAASTSAASSVSAASTAGPSTGGDGEQPSSDALDTFMDAARAQKGDAYVFGASVRLNDPDPSAFDCSELIRWAAHQAGVSVPDGTWLQYLKLKEQGALIPVEEARHTPGALLFSFSSEPTAGGGRPSHSHVAISDGEGSTIEARGRAYGVGSWESKGRFNYAAVVPGLDDASGGTGGRGAGGGPGGGSDPDAAPPSGAAIHGTFVPVSVIDTDFDGLPDDLEARLHTDPFKADTDADGVRDSLEIIYTHTDPLTADPREQLDAALDEMIASLAGDVWSLPDHPGGGLGGGPGGPEGDPGSGPDGAVDPIDPGTGAHDRVAHEDAVQATHVDAADGAEPQTTHSAWDQWAQEVQGGDADGDHAGDHAGDPAGDHGGDHAGDHGGDRYTGGWADDSGWDSGSGGHA